MTNYEQQRDIYLDATNDDEVHSLLYDLAWRECASWCNRATNEHTTYCKRAQKLIHDRLNAEYKAWHK